MAMTAWSAKVVHQLDLLRRERPTNRADKRNHPNGCSFPQKRNTQHCPIAFEFGSLQFIFGIIANVMDVDGSAFQQRAADT